MEGRRLPDGIRLHDAGASEALGLSSIPLGAYWRDEEGWAVFTPNGRLGSIAKHTVVEHDDGTITVSPSILVYPRPGNTYDPAQRADLVSRYGEDCVQDWERGKPEYHGFLEKGIWRSC